MPREIFLTWKIIPTAINEAIMVTPLAAVVNPTKNFIAIFWCYLNFILQAKNFKRRK